MTLEECYTELQKRDQSGKAIISFSFLRPADFTAHLNTMEGNIKFDRETPIAALDSSNWRIDYSRELDGDKVVKVLKSLNLDIQGNGYGDTGWGDYDAEQIKETFYAMARAVGFEITCIKRAE